MTIKEQQSIGRALRMKGSLVTKLPGVQQVSLFEEEKDEEDEEGGTWATISGGESLEGSIYFQGTSCVATTSDDIYTIANVNQMVASHQYTASDFAMLRDKVEELEKQLLEYTERDTKSTTYTGFGAGEYFSTNSDIQFVAVDMVKDPDNERRSITKEEWNQTMKDMNNGS